VAVDARGTVYVINRDRSDVSSGFSPAGTWLTQWRHSYEDENGDPIPLMLTVTAAGGHDVYVGGTLRQSGIAMIERVVRADGPPIFWSLPPPAGQAQVGIQEHVRGLAVGKQGAIYAVSERAGRSRLLRLAPEGKSWAQWDRWIGPSGSIDLWGVAVDRQGNVYVADAGNHCIQKLSPTGEPLACLKGEARSVAVDSRGRIYICDGNRIQELSATGALLATWDAKGTAPGQFKGPAGIAVDTHDNVYVADSGNNRIQKLAVSR
jgi:DNA-binding beta-propeller fold protein YncE